MSEKLTLSELFALAGKGGARFNIEPKSDLDAPNETLAPEPFARALIAEVRKAGVAKRTTVQAFDWRLLEVVEREAPELPTVYCTEGKGSDPARVHETFGEAVLGSDLLHSVTQQRASETAWTEGIAVPALGVEAGYYTVLVRQVTNVGHGAVNDEAPHVDVEQLETDHARGVDVILERSPVVRGAPRVEVRIARRSALRNLEYRTLRGLHQRVIEL